MILENIIIFSGGQSGVDRAALTFALKYNIQCGGWCPKGRLAEDGIIDKIYPLKETLLSDYSQRTQQNINDSDGTLIITSGITDKGTSLTKEIANKLRKPVFEIDLICVKGKDVEKITNWLRSNNISILNIAGPRESSSPGIYNKTLQFLEKFIATD